MHAFVRIFALVRECLWRALPYGRNRHMKCACSQKNYPMAVKMYRMALDQIPISGKEVRFKIMRNIGNAFVRLGQFQDAIQSYEAIMDGNPGRGDETTWFWLL